MKNPTNQRAEVLYYLLQGQMTTRQFVNNGILNPTSVMTKLRSKGVDILCDNIKKKNKFGRKISYGKFNLANKKEAIKLYNKINE